MKSCEKKAGTAKAGCVAKIVSLMAFGATWPGELIAYGLIASSTVS